MTQTVAAGASPSTLTAALKWPTSGADLTSWRSRFEERLDRQLAARCHVNDDYLCIVEGLELLPPELRRRFLRAPAVSSLLLQGDDRGEVEAPLLAEYLRRELTVRFADSAEASAIPTARGATILRVAHSTDRPELVEHRLADTSVALDFASSFRFPDDEFGIEHTAVHTHADRNLVEQRLVEAVAPLRAVTGTLPFVETFIEVVALRRETSSPTRFYSSSFSGLVGLTRLTNAHVGGVDADLLAEALVHEATHALLYMNEELDGPFVLYRPENQTAVTSPWTGSTIRLQSLVHACVVWYATYWFLRHALEREALTSQRTRQRMSLALTGFQDGAVDRTLAPHKHVLSPKIIELIEQVEAEMRSTPST